MPYPPLTVNGLAASGCHLSIDANDYPPLSLQGFVAAAKQANGYIIIRNADRLPPLTAQGLATAGGKHVQLIV